MDSRYKNKLTDLAKRLRPLMVNVAESVVAGSGGGAVSNHYLPVMGTDVGNASFEEYGYVLNQYDSGLSYYLVPVDGTYEFIPMILASSSGTYSFRHRYTLFDTHILDDDYWGHDVDYGSLDYIWGTLDLSSNVIYNFLYTLKHTVTANKGDLIRVDIYPDIIPPLFWVALGGWIVNFTEA